MGIEPTYPAWKAGVLPLNYTRMYIFCFVILSTGDILSHLYFDVNTFFIFKSNARET